MKHWREANTQEEIAQLLEACGGFHDTCLTRLDYQSGAYVDRDRAMHFGGPEQAVLLAVFHSQWNDAEILLRFGGVRKFCTAGWQERYGCDLYDCCLAVHTDLIPGRDEPLILWADRADFSPEDTEKVRHILTEPLDTYIIARTLHWCFAEREVPEEEADGPVKSGPIPISGESV